MPERNWDFKRRLLKDILSEALKVAAMPVVNSGFSIAAQNPCKENNPSFLEMVPSSFVILHYKCSLNNSNSSMMPSF
jgi:hypothetical protein